MPAMGRPRIVASAAGASVGQRKNPRQYGFDIGMWPRHIAREIGDAAILSALESSLDRRGACPTKSDTAEATAPQSWEAVEHVWERLVKTFASIQNIFLSVLFTAQPGTTRILRDMFDQL